MTARWRPHPVPVAAKRTNELDGHRTNGDGKDNEEDHLVHVSRLR